MSVVVFTGAGKRYGKEYARAFWEKDALAAGWDVAKKVYAGVDYLVASRDNTVKARDARAMGVKVITYEDFLDLIGDGHAADHGRESAQEPAKPIPIDTSAMEEIAGWGAF